MMKQIKKVGIAGAGIMGAAISQVLSGHAESITVYDNNPAQFERLIASVKQAQEVLLKHGVLSESEAERNLSRIHTSSNIEALADSDMVIEAILENLAVKQSFFEELEKVCRPDTILATNTSGLGIADIGAKIKDKSRYLGGNWWTPAHLIPLVEIVRTPETSDETVETMCGFLRMAGKKPIVLNRDSDGFVGNRLQFALFREALHVVEEGLCSVEDVDLVLTAGLGLRYAVLGPFRVADFGGVDTYHHISEHLFTVLDNSREVSPVLSRVFEEGRYGVKTKHGFYEYTDDAKRQALLNARDSKLLDILSITGGEFQEE